MTLVSEREHEAAPAGFASHRRAPAVGRLLELSVSDLALIDRLRLVLEPGLNVLTGETGAGKSLIIDALGLALGARADLSLVRHGAASARVEAAFERDREPLLASRELSSVGRSVARLDDLVVTAARLSEVVGPLVEVHGQNDQSRLLDEGWQRELLDAFGDLEPLRSEVARAVEAWAENQAALRELSIDPREAARRIELLRHEVEEIEAARIRDGEVEEIRRRLEASRHGEQIARGAASIRAALDEDGPALASREARAIARLDPRFEAVADRLGGLEAELADIGADVRRLAEAIDHDPTSLAALEERLSVVYGLERRYGDDEAAILAHAERARTELGRLESLDEERARRTAEAARLLEAVAEHTAVLSERRREVAARLAPAIDAALEPLGFRPDAFTIAVGRRYAEPDEPAVEIDGEAVAFDSTGADEVVFRFAPNAGEPARPLAKIASGGELSRVALAIKQVLAKADSTPTLVFDEIDSGIGARAADPIGRSLWELGRSHQVLVVTHLAQIAAHADAHVRIAKRERDGRTITEITRLDREGRIAELAAMLGGPADSGRPAPGDPSGPDGPDRRDAPDGPDAPDGESLAPRLVATARALLEAAERWHQAQARRET